MEPALNGLCRCVVRNLYRLSTWPGASWSKPERLILAGVIVTTFLSSAIVFVTTLMDATRIRSFTFWLLGDLSGATTSLLLVAIVVAVGATLVLTANARSLNLDAGRARCI